MKKICYIAPINQPYVQHWANFFSEKGWKVDIITDRQTSESEFFLNSDIKLHFTDFNLPKFSPLYSNLLANKILRKINPNIIHGHSIGRCFSAISTRKIPFIISEWGPSHMSNESKISNYIKKKIYNYAKVVTACTRSIKSQLSSNYNLSHRKIFLAPWGINTKLFYKGYKRESLNLRTKLGIPAKSPVVICTRTFSSFYSLDLIVSSLPAIFSKRSDVHFIFLKCNTKLFDRLKLKMTKSNFKQNIHFVKELLPHSEIPVYLNASDISLHMTKSENGAGSLLESLACGNLVIATDHADYEERIEEQNLKAFLIKRDVKSITNQIISAIDNLEQKDSFYKHNKKLIETNESQEATFNRIEKLYKYLILKEQS